MVGETVDGKGEQDSVLSTAVPNRLGLPSLRTFSKLIPEYAKDKAGSIAVETAILTPFVLFGLLMAGSLGLSVYNHQKIHTAAYSGASYLQDKIATGDLSGMQSFRLENGQVEVGKWVKTAKLIIKDASGLPLDLDKIGIDTYCACPAMNPGELQNADDADEMQGRQSFYERKPFGVTEGGTVCPASCDNGEKSRVIAEIIIDFDAASLTGGKDTIHEKLVTRLR